MNAWNEEMADHLIPGYMHGGLRRWIENGIEPGGFLMAVLENDLKEAVSRADATNVQALPNYIRYLYNYAPRGCWGSPEKVAAWKGLTAPLRDEK
jgi:hypothetical protein